MASEAPRTNDQLEWECESCGDYVGEHNLIEATQMVGGERPIDLLVCQNCLEEKSHELFAEEDGRL